MKGDPAEDGSPPTQDPPERFQHYFSTSPRTPHRRRQLRFLFRGRLLSFTTDTGVFSYEGLDPGTGLLIECLGLKGSERVLDVGCGWGAVGIAAALGGPHVSVLMVDVNRRAVSLARENAEANGAPRVEVRQGSLYDNLGPGELFDVIATNPPYKAGRALVLRILDEAPAHLAPGGRFLMVGKGGQGIRYYQSHLESTWPAVRVLGRRSGYRVLEARGPSYPE